MTDHPSTSTYHTNVGNLNTMTDHPSTSTYHTNVGNLNNMAEHQPTLVNDIVCSRDDKIPFELPLTEVTRIQTNSSSSSIFAANVLEKIFSKTEIKNSNVYGRAKSGKSAGALLPLKQNKIEYIKALCKKMYTYVNEDIFWKQCVSEMNRRCRKINMQFE